MKRLVFVVFLVISGTSFSQASYEKIHVDQTVSYGEKVLRISVAAEDGETGTFRLADKNGTLVAELPHAEMGALPYYSSMSLEGVQSGDYILYLDIIGKTYSSNITIK